MSTQYITTESDLLKLPKHGITPLSQEEWKRLKPDIHLALIEADHLVSRCSVWQNSLRPEDGKAPAAIGHFEAADSEAGTKILKAACQWLAQRGCQLAVGPMDANTWNKYRLVTYSNGRSPFLLEPSHPTFYVEAWNRAGFEPLVEYHSTEMPPKTEADPRLEKTKSRLQTLGVSIRNLRLDEYERDLGGIYVVSRRAFEPNNFYTPIEEKDFLKIYRPYQDKIDPELVFIAERAGETVGFVFGIPDLSQRVRNETIDTVIYKTIATLPRREFAGLGMWLSHLAHCQAARKGYRKFINALITSQSKLRYAEENETVEFRRYTLFGRLLEE
ncbi:hypothetical protein QEH56_22025 [Pelagicoccus enzymogenes]|uniref:hypothetical protein n=1 Tax=Pelagicoccus enzymogenes TaxID=2773457 RepID=UPI00280F46B4|nr:hypothetical protein [Pelagicoccus enzymogenes]MDQ8200861.1 hypothetical protein [Pelagicoccus enzymogenes]